MKVGIMQPYFVPYLGYFQLINAVDTFVIYDDVNFIKQGWINRNRILLDEKPFLFHLQLSGVSSFKKINEIGLGKNRFKVLKTIQAAYNKAPYYLPTIALLDQIFNFETNNLSEFITNSLNLICKYLNIRTKLILSSEIDKCNDLKGQDKVIEICKILNATSYINSYGGQDLYSKQVFHEVGLNLLFLQSDDIIYNQFSLNFIPALSIVDVMMFNSPDSISGLLLRFELL
jgi:hypothetical protein